MEDLNLLKKIKREVLYGHEILPPQVDPDRCIGCGECVKACPVLVFELQDKKSGVIHGERCNACGHCWAVCPEEAVIQEEVATPTSLKSGPQPAVSPDILQLLFRERRSTRLFKDEPVSKDQLLKIIEAGRYSPTGSNRQDINYTVVSDKQKVSELRFLVENFMERTFKLMENKVFALFYRMKFGQATLDVLRYYAMMYQYLKKGEEKTPIGLCLLDRLLLYPMPNLLMQQHPSTAL